MTRFLIGFCLLASLAMAADGKLMHCFYFTPIAEATDADWQAFYKATGELPSKIDGLSNVWYGKLRRPMRLVSTDGATNKKLRAGESGVTGPVNSIERAHGVCMEMANEATLKSYAGHPAHAAWVKVYEKVRVAGTTTVDIIGE